MLGRVGGYGRQPSATALAPAGLPSRPSRSRPWRTPDGGNGRSASRSARILMYATIHGPIPGSRQMPFDLVVRHDTRVEDDVTVGDRGREADRRAPARPGHRQLVRVGARECSGRRKQMRHRSDGVLERLAVGLHEPRSERGRAGQRHLCPSTALITSSFGSTTPAPGVREPPARSPRSSSLSSTSTISAVGLEVEQPRAARHAASRSSCAVSQKLSLHMVTVAGASRRRRPRAQADAPVVDVVARPFHPGPRGRRRTREAGHVAPRPTRQPELDGAACRLGHRL